MNKEISVRNLSSKAWELFHEHRMQFIMLTLLGFVFSMSNVLVYYYVPQYINIIKMALGICGVVYGVILRENALDAAYGRKLSMVHLSFSILSVSFFTYALNAYFSFLTPQIMAMAVLDQLSYAIIGDIFTYFLVCYLITRCMFIDLVLLEEKVSFLQAFHRSFEMTANHIFLLIGLHLYFVVAVVLSLFTVIGYFFVFPYVLVMRSLLFKQLSGNVKK